MKLVNLLTVNKYYKMTDIELEHEAAKYKIGGYGTANGTVIRERIIEQLIQKDIANNSRFAIGISMLAIVISTLALLLRLK